MPFFRLVLLILSPAMILSVLPSCQSAKPKKVVGQEYELLAEAFVVDWIEHPFALVLASDIGCVPHSIASYENFGDNWMYDPDYLNRWGIKTPCGSHFRVVAPAPPQTVVRITRVKRTWGLDGGYFWHVYGTVITDASELKDVLMVGFFKNPLGKDPDLAPNLEYLKPISTTN